MFSNGVTNTNKRPLRIAFLGNFAVDYSSENHHAKSLEALGHQVIRLQEGSDYAEDILLRAQERDLFIWVHTHGWSTPSNGLSMKQVLLALKNNNIPTLTYHLDLWFGLNRQRDLETDDFYKHIQHFFTVDKKMADWFNENTEVKGHYLQAGVYHDECSLELSINQYRDVVFVGSKNYHHEWQYRPQLIDWLRSKYGDNFLHVGGDGDTGTIRGWGLNRVYNSTKVVVGDSLCLGFNYPYYWSDRVYETLGRGGFLIHPYIQGMGDHFEDGKHLKFYDYNNFEQLEHLINYYLEHDDEREAIRRAGHEHVKENHTYIKRWEYILKEVFNV